MKAFKIIFSLLTYSNILLLLFLIAATSSYSQKQEQYSPKVLGFMNLLEYKYKDTHSGKNEPVIAPEEFDLLLNKYYNAIADDPEGFNRYKKAKNKEYKDAKNYYTFSQTIGLFKRQIQKQYSKKFNMIIDVPYFLRIKILKKEEGISSNELGPEVKIIILTGKIEEVIKGEKRFNKGDTIQFAYNKKIVHMRRNDFHDGGTYFVPLTVKIHMDFEGCFVQLFPDNNMAYPIEHEIIKTPEDFFKTGEANPWSIFKDAFLQKYTIKNMED